MAHRLQLKRSSIAGKRPGPEYLEPGEIALNTNASDPGLYFEANDGSVIKTGPTHIGSNPPKASLGHGQGEQWLDTRDGNLKVYHAATEQWIPIMTASHGGSTTVIYVGSEYPEASDSISNDGTSRPFASVNRACLEVARRSTLLRRGNEPFNDRFAIMLLPGENVVYNDPGEAIDEFLNSNFVFKQNQITDASDLTRFNPTTGGMVLPRGASIVGLTASKTTIRPTHYPEWIIGGDEEAEALNPRTSIIKCTGNSSITDVTFEDKISSVFVTDITGEAEEPAVLHALQPHGYRATKRDETGAFISSDAISISYADEIDTFYEGTPSISHVEPYFADPVSTTEFRLLKHDGSPVLRKELPAEPSPGSQPPAYLNVSYKLETHHRLAAIRYCALNELQDYYSKIQRAFSDIDPGISVQNFAVADGENTIIAPLTPFPTNLTDTTKNAAALVENILVRSNYGMCGVLMEGKDVEGFKTISVSDSEFLSIQKDPDVYEVYYDKVWSSLKAAYAKAFSKTVEAVKDEEAMIWMNNRVETENIRYYHRFDKLSGEKSSGLVDDYSDTRHYALCATNNGQIQANDIYGLGTAVNFWSKSGGDIHVFDSTSNYGTQAIRADGFSGIGTTGGSVSTDRNFSVYGIRRPLELSEGDVYNPDNIKYFFLNTGLAILDNPDIAIFKDPIDFSTLLPYTLEVGSYLWVRRFTDGKLLKAKIIGAPSLDSPDLSTNLPEGQYGIYLDRNDNEWHNENPETLSIPFIRRFVDPRRLEDRNCAVWIENTSSDHRPPQFGSVFRLAEKPGAGNTDILVFGRQFDPGESGGWNHVFSVMKATTKSDGDNPNYVSGESIPNTTTGEYYVTLNLCDSYKPWIQREPGPEHYYAHGSYATFEERIFYAKQNELKSGVTVLEPDSDRSGWELARIGDISQYRNDVYFSDFLGTSDDPDYDKYDSNKKNTYARGLSTDLETFTLQNFINYDDGTSSLGLVDNNGQLNSEIIDPDFGPSKAAVRRFLVLLGFDPEDTDPLLKPQIWQNRNLRVSEMPDLKNRGYAKDVGFWPVEFCRPSQVIAINHHWQWTGYMNYSKGLPEYQNSPLPKRQRFDAISNESWGGQTYSSGVTNNGKFVMNNVTVVEGNGDVKGAGLA